MTPAEKDALAHSQGFCCHAHQLEEMEMDVAWVECRFYQIRCRQVAQVSEVRNWVHRVQRVMVRLLPLYNGMLL